MEIMEKKTLELGIDLISKIEKKQQVISNLVQELEALKQYRYATFYLSTEKIDYYLQGSKSTKVNLSFPKQDLIKLKAKEIYQAEDELKLLKSQFENL